MMFRDIQYDFSEAAYLLFVLPLIIAMFWWLFAYRKKMSEPLASSFYHEQLLIQRHTPFYWNKVFLFCLVWICAVLAFMQPKGNERYPQQQQAKNIENGQKSSFKRKAHDVILLIDASASMTLNDTPSGASRLDYAKEIADQIVSSLTGENVSVLAFTTQTLLLSPSTLDYLFARLMIKQIQINEGETEGTDFLQALRTVSKDYFEVASPKLKTLILLSDGGDTELESLTGSEKENRLNAILSVLNDAERKNLRVFTIGMGSQTGRPIPNLVYKGKPVVSALNEGLMKKLSIRGRGQFFDANGMNAVQIAQAIMDGMAQDNPFVDEKEAAHQMPMSSPIFDLYFQYPLGIALLCLTLVLILPETLRRIIVPIIMLSFGFQLQADQERLAQIYYEAKDFDQAIRVYKEMLAENPQPEKKAAIFYNIGTVLLSKEKWIDAMLQFQQAASIGASPLLEKRLHLNFANANYNVALHSKDEERQIFFLQQAQLELKKAQKAACRVAIAEGEQSCTPDSKILAMEREVKEKLVSLVGTAFENATPEQQAAILVSKHMIMRTIRSFAPSSAESTLKNALNDQEFALRLELLKKSSDSPEIRRMSLNAQTQVLKQARPFLEQVYAQQVQEFHSKKESCQKSPWNEVIPLYNQGLKNAYYARIGQEVIINQEKAIKYWNEALDRWHHPKRAPETKTPESEKQLPPAEQQQASADLNQVLTELQEMEHDDQTQPKIEKKTLNSVERPW